MDEVLTESYAIWAGVRPGDPSVGKQLDKALVNCIYYPEEANGLNLLVAAIILWNTVYLQRAIDHLRKQGFEPEPVDLVHLSPLGWEHINLTGDYHWDAEQSMTLNQFRPLRTRSSSMAMAA